MCAEETGDYKSGNHETDLNIIPKGKTLFDAQLCQRVWQFLETTVFESLWVESKHGVFHINAETHCCNYMNELVRRVLFVIEAFLSLSKFLSEPLSDEGTEDQFNRPFIFIFLLLPGAVDETAKKAPLCTVNCFRADP